MELTGNPKGRQPEIWTQAGGSGKGKGPQARG